MTYNVFGGTLNLALSIYRFHTGFPHRNAPRHLRRATTIVKKWNRTTKTHYTGVVVSTLALINEVNLRRTRLVLRWVTVSGSILGAEHLFQYVTNQPPNANSAFHPYGVGK